LNLILLNSVDNRNVFKDGEGMFVEKKT